MNKQQIDLYIQSKEQAWASSTLQTERARLYKLGALFNFSPLPEPAQVYATLVKHGYKSYSIKTSMIRLGELHAPIKLWMKQNAQLFKNAYVPRRAPMTFQEALDAIKQLPTEQMQRFARGLLASGLRISEAFKVRADGTVVGKGGRVRQVPNNELVANTPGCSNTHFRNALRRIGLTPHLLRKIAASRAVELGAREAELLQIFGWTNMQTASYYVQGYRADEVSKKLAMEITKND